MKNLKSYLSFMIMCVCVFMLASCIPGKNDPDYDAYCARREARDNNNAVLITLEFNGDKHEYVDYKDGYKGSLSHWASCKYCKEDSVKHQANED